MAKGIVDNVRKGLKRQGKNVRRFVSGSRGPFETADRMVKQTRKTIKKTARSAGAPTLSKQMRKKPIAKKLGLTSRSRRKVGKNIPFNALKVARKIDIGGRIKKFR